MATATPTRVVVLGARNLGAIITRDLLGRGAQVATVARTTAHLEPLEALGAATVRADAGDRTALGDALRVAADRIGPARPHRECRRARPPAERRLRIRRRRDHRRDPRRVRRVGGCGRAADLRLPRCRSRRTHRPRGNAGADHRRAFAPRGPARGLVAAGAAATRALTHAAALELAADGLHVALLVVDGPIASPKTARMTAGLAPEAIVDPVGVATAVHALASQPARAWTHELVVTPAGGRWVP